MPTAAILINALVPPQAVPIDVLVAFSNNGTGGENTFAWTVLDQPEGAPDALIGGATPTPTLTPTKEGTYLILEVVNQGQATEQRQMAIFYVKRLLDGRRLPAAGETTEANMARGWAEEVNRQLNDIANLRSDSGRIAGPVAVNGTQAGLTVLYVSSTQTIKAGLPGAELLPTLDVAQAGTKAKVSGSLYVLDRGVVNGAAPVAGEIVWARRDGIAYGVPLAGMGVGQAVYVSNVGTLSDAPGSNPRRVGMVVAARTNDCDVLVSGSLQFGQAGTLHRFGSVEGSTGTPWPLPFGFQQVVPAVFLPWRVSRPGRWSYLAVQLFPNAANRTLRVRAYKNANPTTLVAQVTDVAPLGNDFNELHAVEFDYGDLMDWRVENVTPLTGVSDISGIAGTFYEQIYG